MVARSRDVNISYSVDSNKRKNRKRKRTGLVADAGTFKQHDANGPPDKAKDIKTAKRARRRGKGLINSMVEVEYKEKKMKMENSVIWGGWRVPSQPTTPVRAILFNSRTRGTVMVMRPVIGQTAYRPWTAPMSGLANKSSCKKCKYHAICKYVHLNVERSLAYVWSNTMRVTILASPSTVSFIHHSFFTEI